MTSIADNANIIGVKYSDASGNIGNENRTNPYPPIFKRTPARMTEPAVGASTWASGSQVCTGHIGTLTANEAKNASHSHFCNSGGKLWGGARVMAVLPFGKKTQRIASSESTDPRSV